MEPAAAAATANAYSRPEPVGGERQVSGNRVLGFISAADGHELVELEDDFEERVNCGS